MEQKKIFLTSEGNNWYHRNNKADTTHETLRIIEALNIKPKRILEIGCSNGMLLNLLQQKYSCECIGIDPSLIAIADGRRLYSNITLLQGTSDELLFEDGYFDLIIFGFCLYLCDRKDLFKIAHEADRCLSKGYIIIKDFDVTNEYRNDYKHCEGVSSYKMDYSKMFIWNNKYSLIYKQTLSHDNTDIEDINNRVSIQVLKT